MKKLFTIILSVIFIFSLSACAPGNFFDKKDKEAAVTATITREQAIEKALEKVGLSQSEVRDLDADLDRERATLVWEVDFEHENREYAFEIDATTGEVLISENEFD